MLLKSGVTVLRRNILTLLAESAFQGTLIDDVERIPEQILPDGAQPFRCCIFKDREIIKERIKIMLGFSSKENMQKDLRSLAESIMNKDPEDDGFWLSPIKIGCDTCPTHKYYITEGCRNCVAHLCEYNCPKNAIQIINNRAFINESVCVECGKCAKVCPFHAIIELKRPCEYACPVGAITVNEDKTVNLDPELCILCGKCTTGCPFGAIEEKSQLISVIRDLQNDDTPVYAMIAPAIFGQFSPLAGFPKINGALVDLGFDGVFDVGEGANETTSRETDEFLEYSKEEKLLTTSCCPSFVLCLQKHFPKLKEHISHTPSPMIFSARQAKELHPSAKLVFIGPCLSKKEEAQKSGLVDYVLTFEELAALFVAKKIDVSSADEVEFVSTATKESRLFPLSGGVAGSIKAQLTEKNEDPAIVNPVIINGINKDSMKVLKAASFGKIDGNLIEGMSCEFGCIGGPHVLTQPKVTARLIQKYIKDQAAKTK